MGTLGYGRNGHTCRYVLEQYNVLSWLVMDPVGADRKSCLPIHVQSCLRLYSAIESLVL